MSTQSLFEQQLQNCLEVYSARTDDVYAFANNKILTHLGSSTRTSPSQQNLLTDKMTFFRDGALHAQCPF